MFWLNKNKVLPTVLINPAVEISDSLKELKGAHADCYGLNFTLTDEDIYYLKSIERKSLRKEERYLVLLQTGDEILNYKKAAEFFKKYDVVIENGGNHRFENFERHCLKIKKWLESKDCS